MQVGKWLDNQGIDAKPCVRASAAPALPAVPTQKAVEKLLAAVYAPWNDMDNSKHRPVKVCTNFAQRLATCTQRGVDLTSLLFLACLLLICKTVLARHDINCLNTASLLAPVICEQNAAWGNPIDVMLNHC